MDLWSFADQLAVSSLRKMRQSARFLKNRKKNRGYFRDRTPRTDLSISQKKTFIFIFLNKIRDRSCTNQPLNQTLFFN